jgi:hypothetical protein
MCVLICLKYFHILRRIQRDTIINVPGSSCNVPVILVRFERNLNFLDRFSKNTHISNLKKIRPVGAELFHSDRQTDRQTDRHDEANSRFSQFAKVPKNAHTACLCVLSGSENKERVFPYRPLSD